MSSFNEDLVLEYLIENIDPGLSKQSSLRTASMMDYCYKRNEALPFDHVAGAVSRVLSKQVNDSSNSRRFDESSLDYRLFLDSFISLLSNSRSKELVKYAKTAHDFKAVMIIDVFSKGLKNPNKFFDDSSSLDSKVFNIVKAFEDSRFEEDMQKDYLKMKEYFLKVNEDLKKPLNSILVERFGKVKMEMDEKLKIYSKYPNRGNVADIQRLILDTKQAIDNLLEGYISEIDQRYNGVKKVFEEGVWDSKRKVNKLISLRSEIENIRSKYKVVSHRNGIMNCNSLDSRIKDTIFNYDYIQDKKEEFKSVKRDIINYYGEVYQIFKEPIDFSSVNRLNSIYSNLRRLSNREFAECVPSTWQEDYNVNIEAAMMYIKEKCTDRALYLTDQSSKYRQKIDSSFFSWRTKKFIKKLTEYNDELEAWSKCRII